MHGAMPPRMEKYVSWLWCDRFLLTVIRQAQR